MSSTTEEDKHKEKPRVCALPFEPVFSPGDSDAWEKPYRALKAQVDPNVFEQTRGTVSFPFEPGEHKRIAVKVIDFRGNEG